MSLNANATRGTHKNISQGPEELLQRGNHRYYNSSSLGGPEQNFSTKTTTETTMNEDSFLPVSKFQPRPSPSIGPNTHRRPPTLCPIPGALPGSRKRRVFSRHGPFSSAISPGIPHTEDEKDGDVPSNSTAHCSAKVTPVLSLMTAHGADAEAEAAISLQAPGTLNCSSPITPKGPSKEMKDTISGPEYTEPLYRTPARGRNAIIGGHHQGITMSPTSSDMQLFQHLSIRSPRLSKSPGSSFSQYTRSATSISASACGVTLNTPNTARGSLDGSDTNMFVQNQQRYSNKVKMVPLTIISNKCSSDRGVNCEYPTPTNSQAPSSSSGLMDTSSKSKALTPRSKGMIISPRPRKPSGYLPCPTPRSLPSPIRRSTNFFNGVESYWGETTKQAAVISVEKPVSHCRRSPYEDVSPMMSLSPLGHQPTATTAGGTAAVNINSTVLKSEPPPPITFLSTDQDKNKLKRTEEDNSSDGGNLRNKPAMKISTSRSLFKPASTASNDALNEMLLDDGDTDGTLSDSDDEGGDNGFFLSDPSCLSFPRVLSLPPRGSLPSALNSQSKHNTTNSSSDQPEAGELGMSLAAAYSLKTKKKKVHNTICGDYPTFPSLSTNFDKGYTSQNHTFSRQASEQNKEGSSSESNSSLFGMNIIHENSISNGSLADIGVFSSTKKNSCRSFTEESQTNGSFLNRSKSDQSINSLGLCIDNCTGTNDGYSNRDMVTPPVNSRTMSSPPPLKQTRLTSKSHQP